MRGSCYMGENFGTGLGLATSVEELIEVLLKAKFQVVSEPIETITLGNSPGEIIIGKRGE